MGARRTARERALQALYQLDVLNQSTPEEALDLAWRSGGDGAPVDDTAREFALQLVRGVTQERATLDALLESHSLNWKLERMSVIDRNILRLGAYELCHRHDVPPKVALNEAIELGKTFGSQDSSSFINGLLDKIAQGVAR